MKMSSKTSTTGLVAGMKRVVAVGSHLLLSGSELWSKGGRTRRLLLRRNKRVRRALGRECESGLRGSSA